MSRQEDGDATEDRIEEDSFGYSLEGSWSEVVRFGEKIVSALEDHDVEQDTISEWDSWRPRSGEREDEMREKTVEKAKVDEGEDTAESAAETAEKLSETREKTSEGQIGEAAEKASEASKSAGKAVGGASRDVVRAVEDRVYRRITKNNPLYFDSENFNASLEVVESIGEKVGKFKDRIVNGEREGNDGRRYRMSINAESEEVEEALNEEFEDDG